jgi:hypothetical protein
MPDTIRDGRGGGYLAAVNDDNHLLTLAATRSDMAFHSENNSAAYSVYGRSNFDGVTETGLLFFTYTGEKAFYIDSITLSASPVASLKSVFHAKAEVFVDATYTSGGTAIDPINMDRSSTKTLSSTALTGVTALVVTKGISEVVDIRLSSGDSKVVNFSGGLILGQGNTIFILGEVNAPTDKMRAMILGYEKERT